VKTNKDFHSNHSLLTHIVGFSYTVLLLHVGDIVFIDFSPY